MKAAIVTAMGKTPIYGDFKDPVPESGEVQVTVSAVARNACRCRTGWMM